MNNNNNIVMCSICRASLIYEELDNHTCFTKNIVEFMYDTGSDEYFLYDGNRWYRWFPEWLEKKSPTESQQRDKTTDKPTEPNFLTTFCNIL